MRRRRPTRRLGLYGGVAVAMVAAAGYLLWFAPSGVERALSSALEAAGRAHPVDVDRVPMTVAPRDAERSALAREMLDGVRVGETRYFLLSDGVVSLDGDGRVRSLLEGERPTALEAFGGRLVVGTESGALVAFDGERAERVTFRTPTRGAPITRLAVAGDTLHVATGGAGVILWGGGERARWLAPAGGAVEEITAMALGEERLALGTEAGAVVVVAGGRLHRPSSSDPSPGHVSSLAWDGEALWVGRPFGLERIERSGRARLVRDRIHVTSLFSDADRGRLYVGTFGRGVLVLDDEAGERILGGQLRIHRIRRLDGEPVAFGAGGAWRIHGDALSALVPEDPHEDSRL